MVRKFSFQVIKKFIDLFLVESSTNLMESNILSSISSLTINSSECKLKEMIYVI
jgi:hypothetical protein